MVNPETTCEQIWREISNYIDGEVAPALRSSMDEHFRICPRCASVLAGTKNVVQLYGDERMLEVPAGFSRRLEKRLSKNAIPAESRWSTWSAWLVPIAAVALFLASLALVDQLTFKNPPKSVMAERAYDIPANLTVVVSAGSKVFHVPGCPFIHDKATERTMTAKEAMHDGYVPCSRCLRQYLKASVTGGHGGKNLNVDDDDDHDEIVVGSAGQ